MTKVLITGARGFLAPHVAQSFIQNNLLDSVYMLNGNNFQLLTMNHLTNIFKLTKRIDITNREHLNIIKPYFDKNKLDCIINFAAESHNDTAFNKPEQFFKTNSLGPTVLNEVFNPSIFIQMSTDEVLGESKNKTGSVYDIDKCPNPRNIYSITKYGGEQLLNTSANNLIIIRSSNVYGPGQRLEKFIPNTIHSIMNDKPVTIYGNGRQFRQWFYIRDFTKIFNRILKNEVLPLINEVNDYRKTIHITSNDIKENIEVVNCIYDIMKKTPYINFIEDPRGKYHDFGYTLSSTYKKKNYTPFEVGIKQTIESMK